MTQPSREGKRRRMLGGCPPSFENVEIWLRCQTGTFLAKLVYILLTPAETRGGLESCRCGTSSILSVLTEWGVYSAGSYLEMITLLILCQERAARASGSALTSGVPAGPPPAPSPVLLGVRCALLLPCAPLIIHSEISVRAWSADHDLRTSYVDAHARHELGSTRTCPAPRWRSHRSS